MTPLQPLAHSWKDLYLAALFEPDSAKMAERIAEAERAVVVRARELFHISGDHIEEEEALDNAMYALRALRNTYHCAKEDPPARSDAA
ncbi:MAG: hypothetical protein DMG68_20935 [Acidobacteria bacterium]|jgi:hypothetical protein|nr:MAG: hypothetical protein DMG68_20935 [Acidobacteriota bacterium]